MGDRGAGVKSDSAEFRAESRERPGSLEWPGRDDNPYHASPAHDTMTDEDATRLEDYRFQMGHDAGNLAMALDQLTDALAALNQHAVYYRLEQGQRRSAPPDLAPLAGVIADVKKLVQETLLRLRGQE
jgi:hypothetical protein